MTYFFRQQQMAKGWGKEINAAWDEADHPRGKTTEASNSGSFAPKEGGGAGGASKDPERLRTAGDEDFKRHVGNMADIYQRAARGEAGADKLLQQNYQTAAGVYGNDYAKRVEAAAQAEADRRDKAGEFKEPPLGSGVKGTSYKVRDKIEVGAILRTSWGYDQTNTEFYEVTGMSKSGKTVTIRELAKNTVETGFLSGYTRPVLGKYMPGEKAMTKKILPNNALKIHGNYGYAHLWDGTDQHVSWGH